MEKQRPNGSLVLILLCLSISLSTFAQGDGPRNLLWSPKGTFAFLPKWMGMNQNITPGNVLVKDADLHIDAFPLTLVYNFGLANRYAQVMLNAVPGDVSGRLAANQPGLPAPHLSSSGFADGFIGFKLGLINQPALNVIEYSQYQKKTFSMMVYTRLWYSGSYDNTKPLNLGSNRLTFEIGFPIDLWLSKDPKRPTWLEIYPSIHMYTPNNDPLVISMANKTQQHALYSLENHLSHNITDKFWASADLRYQYGGDVAVDGIDQDNKQNILGGGFTVGYQLLKMLGLNATYGTIIAGDNGADSNMVRITAVLSYANLKKLQKPE
ncbi:transporter [Flavobacterium sp. JAS]|uniref:transporter n=1 Tax=Flavobacterium sp. JAS TaxID=2897329 RepID=UPI001E4A1D2C|nr:transporter [Flavobacterium sp. JAS]MCD0471887.1 transporter [Flavobacterium sp. JAS]